MDTVVVTDLATLPLEPSQPVVYDRPIGLRLLYADPVSGAEHYLVGYPAGMRALRHTHTAAHTIVVLTGRLEVDGAVLDPGSYAHFPAGVEMVHQPTAEEGCRFVIVFDGPFDVQPV